MPVETVQMLMSACLRHGIEPNVLTSKGTILKGSVLAHQNRNFGECQRARAPGPGDRLLCKQLLFESGHTPKIRVHFWPIWGAPRWPPIAPKWTQFSH